MHFAVGLSGTLAFGFVVAAFLDDDAFGAAVVFLGSIGGGATTDPAPVIRRHPKSGERRMDVLRFGGNNSQAAQLKLIEKGEEIEIKEGGRIEKEIRLLPREDANAKPKL